MHVLPTTVERPLEHVQALVVVVWDAAPLAASVPRSDVTRHHPWTPRREPDVEVLHAVDRGLQTSQEPAGEQPVETVAARSALAHLPRLEQLRLAMQSPPPQRQVLLH